MIRLGHILQSMAIAVMRPEDLVEFSRQSYDAPRQIEEWGRKEFIDIGLDAAEEGLLEKSPSRSGEALLLGIGGGREALAMARRGFHVTGVDFIAGMVERAQLNAEREGLTITGKVQDMLHLELPDAAFDLVWFSPRLYSVIPTRSRRIDLLHKVAATLKPGGCAICQFHWDSTRKISSRSFNLYRFLARMTFGYNAYEEGDILWRHKEFLHVFQNANDLRREFWDGGFSIAHLEVHDSSNSGGAVLLKQEASG